MKISGYFQAIFLASTILILGAIPISRNMKTRVGDIEVRDPHFKKKAVQLGSVSDEEQNLIVLMHKSYRAQVQSTNMMNLQYHAGIAEKAQALADTCVFAHDTANNRSVAELPSVYVGQNLCMGQSSWADCINDWANEKNNFAYGIGSTNGGVIGHYTQMMLWKTMAIGCGFNTCDGSPLYVCNYAYGQYSNDMNAPWKSGIQCADCPNTCTVDGFCDCGGRFCNIAYKVMAPTCECMNWWTI
ncbi:hypothetical protein CHS0354_038605 [Potamilus streckersoni]|uniref:SCP domain-containing protein n=1 Tax=Potamilus streckersoni TaxID=2493646 RepID=A0AAE0TFU2_9BIVA|nr:hypothetical protein CHS0354_038605 [Potamilus streckersoni]